ncbi:Lrp/AsnC family transcriptional regulator [Futiania mangrovi]|uniref:Lrp/AsnC ligand binding domain-containing protein n=1 Tax=Futiania mangrovi TaxID=2959716 RepID=A0A9J6PGL0_9PROT|nr:Lrp/AsnC ligand binding domain-containing protein [Futiania mangrovii]MCP1337614.1 Lrp/AsnC ligand binding domain-containing protein [Futiania mangrovii]
MKPVFVQIKCELGRAYAVADQLVQEVEQTSEVYSTSGHYDLLAKFYLGADEDIGRFVNEKVHPIPGVRDTFTIITFKAFA